jgi:hypothetical protein
MEPLDLQDQVCFAKVSKEAELPRAAGKAAAAPSRPRPLVSWLRKTEYISSNSKQFGRHIAATADGAQGHEGAGAPPPEGSREAEVAAIAATFEHVKRQTFHTLRHPAKRSLKAVEIIPVFPDFVMWPNKYDLVTFDGDPLSKDTLKVRGVGVACCLSFHGRPRALFSSMYSLPHVHARTHAHRELRRTRRTCSS